MNGFLVMLHHTMDDLPVRLFATRRAAIACAKKLSAEPEESIREIFRRDCSMPVCTAVVEFRQGKPVRAENVRHFL